VLLRRSWIGGAMVGSVETGAGASCTGAASKTGRTTGGWRRSKLLPAISPAKFLLRAIRKSMM
jgi:hypothetical protein